MKKEQWIDRIKEHMEKAGVYMEVFNLTVEVLAEILAKRDAVMDEFENSGSKIAIEHTLDRGARNIKINPLIRTWAELNHQALDYLNALGLTGKSLKQITGSVNASNNKTSYLERIIEELGI